MPDLGIALDRFFANPKRFGALAPSSVALASLITSEVRSDMNPVVELGPGTGVFTRALLHRDIAEHNIILVEADPKLATRLSTRFPNATIMQQDADSISHNPLFTARRASAIISGLPLLNFSLRKVALIIESALKVLNVNGAIYQFTYGLKCPVNAGILAANDLEATHIGRVWRNFPPASVYRITRRDHSREGLI